jgi:hypothetical protein
MNLTIEQAIAFVYALLGEDREKNGRYVSPIVVAYLSGVLPTGRPSPREVIPIAEYNVGAGRVVRRPGSGACEFAVFLEAIARALRNPEDPVQVEDLVRCEACSITAHHEDARAAGWVCGEDCWECPRCIAVEKQGQGAP